MTTNPPENNFSLISHLSKTERTPQQEVCFLIGKQQAILWCDLSTSPILLADSRTRWEAIWKYRESLEEIAHSHPMGPLAFSTEDQTTMEALRCALPTKIRFSVLAPNGMIVCDENKKIHTLSSTEEPWWTDLLRFSSGMVR